MPYLLFSQTKMTGNFHGGQIERLVEGALIAGSVAEECDADL